MKKITPKSFAQVFVRLRNSVESAIRLGVPPRQAKSEGDRLLNSPVVKREIVRLDKQDNQTLAYVKTGLTRLAFGQINDAAALVFTDQPDPEQIAQADLFNVSEIKRVKGGGVEIKIFDRHKALEKLFELDPELREHSKADQFLKAISDCAQGDISNLVQDSEEDDDEYT